MDPTKPKALVTPPSQKTEQPETPKRTTKKKKHRKPKKEGTPPTTFSVRDVDVKAIEKRISALEKEQHQPGVTFHEASQQGLESLLRFHDTGRQTMQHFSEQWEKIARLSERAIALTEGQHAGPSAAGSGPSKHAQESPSTSLASQSASCVIEKKQAIKDIFSEMTATITQVAGRILYSWRMLSYSQKHHESNT